MIKILGKIPETVVVACSGGSDSMAILDFLRRSKRKIHVAHFNHGTSLSDSFQECVEKYCLRHKIGLTVGTIIGTKGPDESPEEFWRNERIRFFRTFKRPIVTGHNLNDVAEWWIFTSLNGVPRLIPYSYQNIIRPFLITKKSSFEGWCERKNVDYVYDKTNQDVRFSRNRIRHDIMPGALLVNPGFLKVIEKKLTSNFNEE